MPKALNDLVRSLNCRWYLDTQLALLYEVWGGGGGTSRVFFPKILQLWGWSDVIVRAACFDFQKDVLTLWIPTVIKSSLTGTCISPCKEGTAPCVLFPLSPLQHTRGLRPSCSASAVLHTGAPPRKVWAELQPAPPPDQAKTRFGKPECDYPGSTQLAQAGPAAWGCRWRRSLATRTQPRWDCAVCCCRLSPVPLTVGTVVPAVPLLGTDQPELWQPALPKPASTGRGTQDGVDLLCTLGTGIAPEHAGSGDKGALVFLDSITLTSQREFRLSPGQTCLKPKGLRWARISWGEVWLRTCLRLYTTSGLCFFSRYFIIRGCMTHQRNLAKLQLAFCWRTVWRHVAKSFYTMGLSSALCW